MQDGKFPVALVSGVPVMAAPEEIDITNALLAAHKRAQADGGELRLVIPDVAVLRVFAITGIDRMIPNFTSLDDALQRTSPGGLDSRRHPDTQEGTDLHG